MRINVVVGDENDTFSREIADKLNAELVEIHTERFKDNEIKATLKIKPGEKFKRKKALLAQRIDRLDPNQNDCIVKIMQIIGSLKRLAYLEFDLLTPYIPYSRQDSIFLPGEPVSLIDIGNLYRNLGVSRFFTVNSHIYGKPSTYLRQYFHSPYICVNDINPAKLFADHLKKKNLKDSLVLGPDEGSEKMVRSLSKHLNTDYRFLEKERDETTGDVTIEDKGLEDLEGRDVIIYDDIVSTGGTISRVHKLVENYNPRKIYIAIVHLLTKKGIQRLYNLGSDGVITTNSLISEPSEFYETIPLEPLISDYIKNPPQRWG